MVYAADPAPGALGRDRGGRRGGPRALLHRRRRRARAGAPGARHRGALRLPDGHRMGQGRRDRRDLRAAGAARRPCRAAPAASIQRFSLKQRSRALAQGRAIGQRIGAGPARVVSGAREMSRVQPGDVLVSDMTDPDWEPVMKRAAAIVTNRGGRTCHAAIIARELGIPAVVGCGDATDEDPRRRPGHGVLRRGRHRRRLRGPPRLRAAAHRARRAAAAARAHHDERRQPRPRLRLRVDPEPRRRARAPRVHHQPHDRRAPAGAARVRDAGARRARRRCAARWPATTTRWGSSSRSSRRASPASPRPSRRSR